MQKAPVYYPMMDVVRYILSLGVLYCHVLFLTDSTLPTFNLSFYSVGGFFALSGFLMYPNYTRHMQPWLYVRHRARRILPPYFFIVLLCALTLWSVSSCGVGEYFSAPVFWKYLGANLTFLNWFEPALPGVFDSSGYVDSAVNGSLWTMKVEWCLYLSLPVFVWICRKLKTRFAYVAVTVILFSIIWRICLYSMYVGTGKQIYEILGRQVMGMLAYFYCGVILYFTRDQIQKRPWFWITMGLLLIVIGNLDRNGFHLLSAGHLAVGDSRQHDRSHAQDTGIARQCVVRDLPVPLPRNTAAHTIGDRLESLGYHRSVSGPDRSPEQPLPLRHRSPPHPPAAPMILKESITGQSPETPFHFLLPAQKPDTRMEICI